MSFQFFSHLVQVAHVTAPKFRWGCDPKETHFTQPESVKCFKHRTNHSESINKSLNQSIFEALNICITFSTAPSSSQLTNHSPCQPPSFHLCHDSATSREWISFLQNCWMVCLCLCFLCSPQQADESPSCRTAGWLLSAASPPPKARKADRPPSDWCKHQMCSALPTSHFGLCSNKLLSFGLILAVSCVWRPCSTLSGSFCAGLRSLGGLSSLVLSLLYTK